MILGKFENWLKNHGCEIIPPTNEYEVLRWKGAETGVMYTTGKTNGKYANEAFKAYNFNLDWKGGAKKFNRKASYKKERKALLIRDGDVCFLCGEKMGEDCTVDHLQPLGNGGNNKLTNMVLMHESCNNECGNISLHQKVNLAVLRRQVPIPKQVKSAEEILMVKIPNGCINLTNYNQEKKLILSCMNEYKEQFIVNN